MAEWLSSCAEKQFSTHYKHLKKMYSSGLMSKTFIIFLLLSGVGVAYFVTNIPRLMTIFVLIKNQLSTSQMRSPSISFMPPETSLVLRPKNKLPISPEVEKEAVAALTVALDLQSQGKTEKAIKVFQHALALDPLHADILTAYGEFVEKHEHDVVKADHLYRKALHAHPEHEKALENRRRTQPVVEEIDQRTFNRIDQKRDKLYRVPPNHPGLRRAKKESYFYHIYHSNAIEGNTLTLAQTRSIVETRIAVGGKSLAEQNEVLGLDAALSFINSTLLGRVGQLCLEDILDIHRRVLGYVDPTEAGRIRKTQVFVGDFQPPSPKDVPMLMNQFVDWLNSEDALELHPIEFAALAHYKLVIIHPFYDGNGRTSRLLMNLILMQAGFPPVTVRVEDRLRYYETIQMGNEGDIHPFIRFMAESTERTLDEFILSAIENPVYHSHQINQTSNKGRVIDMDEDDDEDDDYDDDEDNGNDGQDMEEESEE
ncbi:protein adenylyltransferase FICD-like [Haliotis asinina]|uniref:protein adenylyltransferase FICD-like n=1 Tax=Haliotis asinina TaxID=109174 RepID=UPI003532412F